MTDPPVRQVETTAGERWRQGGIRRLEQERARLADKRGRRPLRPDELDQLAEIAQALIQLHAMQPATASLLDTEPTKAMPA